ncbi:RimJ/RimL family protein N-acetyltransferase [Fontibacillus phaseoli]|uniref:RimJ/RimL family protein N-acetyltransferase n=1 Tax=Fontibacillus phaseoli TaxID=1416533 RepID=A0A369BLU3_9BACL|nr:GNAT family N-acetyltransferase [Fontibacillus phaseoli]RCX21427.1 RimJ/RimL family protein N-acetyltransferase [Fontibacillus phaseoli]
MGWFEPIRIVDKYNQIIEIRTAVGHDADRILAYNREIISSESFLLTVPEEFDRTVEMEREWIEETLNKESSLILLAEEQGKVVGLLDFHSGHKRRIAHTGYFGMSVRSDYQGGGIGKALLQALIDWAVKHHKLEKISLEVFANNSKAIQLYRKLGFVQESLLRKQIKLQDGSYVDVIGMSLLLSPA